MYWYISDYVQSAFIYMSMNQCSEQEQEIVLFYYVTDL